MLWTPLRLCPVHSFFPQPFLVFLRTLLHNTTSITMPFEPVNCLCWCAHWHVSLIGWNGLCIALQSGSLFPCQLLPPIQPPVCCECYLIANSIGLSCNGLKMNPSHHMPGKNWNESLACMYMYMMKSLDTFLALLFECLKMFQGCVVEGHNIQEVLKLHRCLVNDIYFNEIGLIEKLCFKWTHACQHRPKSGQISACSPAHIDALFCCILLDVGLQGWHSVVPHAVNIYMYVIMRRQTLTPSESLSSAQNHVRHSPSQIEECMIWCRMLAGYPWELIDGIVPHIFLVCSCKWCSSRHVWHPWCKRLCHFPSFIFLL